MRWMVLALCACNRVLGLGDVGLRDAQFFDGLVDAQPSCPTLGNVPQFSPVFHQVIDQNCHEYATTMVGDFALADCGNISPTIVWQGAIDQALQPAQGFPTNAAMIRWSGLRLSPEGDVAYLMSFDSSNATASVRSFTHVGGSTWMPGPSLPIVTFGEMSGPSRGPMRHVLFSDVTTTLVEEWAQDAVGAWHRVRTTDLGLIAAHTWLSVDGLRAVVTAEPPDGGDDQLLYLDRATIDNPFGPAQPLTSLPPTTDLFITADCSRAYTSTAASIFYAPQI